MLKQALADHTHRGGAGTLAAFADLKLDILAFAELFEGHALVKVVAG